MGKKKCSGKKNTVRRATNEVLAALEANEQNHRSCRDLCREISRKYSVNYETLRSAVKLDSKKRERVHGNCLLTDAQENRLVGYCLAMEELGAPVTKRQVRIIVDKWYNLKTLLLRES